MDSHHLWILALFFLTAVLYKTTKGVILDMPSPTYPHTYIGDSVRVRCVGSDHGSDIGDVTLFKDGRLVQSDSNHQIIRTANTVELTINPVSAADQGSYSCVRNGSIELNQKPLYVIRLRRIIYLITSSNLIPARGFVTLTCYVEGFEFPQWLRRNSVSDSDYETLEVVSATIEVSRGGVYSCRGIYELMVTEESTRVIIRETGLPIQMPPWASLGDTVTVQCVGPVKTFLYFYKDGIIVKKDTHYVFERLSETTVKLLIHSVSASDEGWYSCGIRDETLYSGEQLQILPGRRITLTAESDFIPNQGSVRLSCEIERVQKYEWTRRFFLQTSKILQDTPSVTVSHGGVYSCRGKEEFILTPESNNVTIWETVPNRAVVQPEPARTQLLSGESLSLRCEVEAEGGSDSEWSYEWRKTGVILATVTREYTLSNVSMSDSGAYSCRGTRGGYQTTQWSEDTRLQVLNKVVPVLSVSPLWLSPGASVSLKCNVTAPSAGWRFYWFKAVPLTSGSYSYELLPGLSSGTAHGSFTVHSLSSTVGFVCRAGRGTPEGYTEYSPPRFVWSADAGSTVSPTVNPNSSQQLTFDSVSVSCGSSDEDWRVQMFSMTSLSLLHCSSHRGKHQCDFSIDQKLRAVFWCESGSGEMTNAVNITFHDSVILLTPVQPVSEGHSVSLTCKLGQSAGLSSVRFYKDGQLIQEGPLRTYIISALSKSDEGLYKCSQHLTSNKVLTSAESWMSVRNHLSSVSKERSSSVLIPVLVGVACLILVLILLLILWRYRKNKDLCFIRSKETSQTSAQDHVTTISPSEEVTYTELEFKVRKPRGKEQEDVYSNVIAQSAADVDVMYSQINHYKKRKATVKYEAKPPDVSADETVYSEVRKTVGPKD